MKCLGSYSFIIFINDLPDVVKNLCVLFVDDTKVFGPVGNEEDRVSLHEALNNMLKWSNEWQLKFNTTKCKVMHYGRENRNHKYSVKTYESDYKLESITKEKDLGVIFTTALKFSRNVGMAANKANRVVGAIRRSFRYMDGQMFVQLYKSMVRVHLNMHK